MYNELKNIIGRDIVVLPNGTVILDESSFFYYDKVASKTRTSMSVGHFHNFCEIYYLQSGACEYLVNDKLYSIKSGSFIFIPQNNIHKAIYTTEAHTRVLLSFSEDYLTPVFDEALTKVQLFSLNKDLDFVENLIGNIAKEAHNSNNISKALIRSYITELLAYIIRNKSSSTAPLLVENDIIDEVRHYISENYSANINLAEVAKMFHYSKNYLSKIFKQSTGIGFKEYLLLLRLNEAEKRLLATNDSIREIAYSCGFNDSNYFSSKFTKKYGFSPLNYRKSQRTLHSNL